MSPSDDEDLSTLEADLRRALQHQHAEYERVRETQKEIEALIERARALLAAAEEGDLHEGEQKSP